MRHVLVILVALCVCTAGAVTAFADNGGPPAGATAQCRDGSYSFSTHRSGTCSHHGGVAAWLTDTSAAPAAATPALGRTVLLGSRVQTAGCRRGALPDRACSPGAEYSGLTKKVLCSSSFHTSSVRNVPDSEKHRVEIEYGMAPRAYGRTIEIDHIVSLELGGSNDIANLFPEPGSGAASYHVKDRLENRLHQLVCAGSMSLHAAQLGIARNWMTLYKRVFGAPA